MSSDTLSSSDGLPINLPSETVSVAPPCDFFHMVFDGPGQDLMVPITYGSELEGRARLKVAETQIRQVVGKPKKQRSATIRISHLQELMSHHFDGGIVVQDALGMGAVVVASNPNGSTTTVSGDVFIRIVPRLPGAPCNPDIPFPDSNNIHGLHLQFEEDRSISAEFRPIDFSHHHSFWNQSSLPSNPDNAPVCSPIPHGSAILACRQRTNQLLTEATSEFQNKICAALVPKKPSIVDSRFSDDRESESTSSVDSDSVTNPILDFKNK